MSSPLSPENSENGSSKSPPWLRPSLAWRPVAAARPPRCATACSETPNNRQLRLSPCPAKRPGRLWELPLRRKGRFFRLRPRRRRSRRRRIPQSLNPPQSLTTNAVWAFHVHVAQIRAARLSAMRKRSSSPVNRAHDPAPGGRNLVFAQKRKQATQRHGHSQRSPRCSPIAYGR
jgi:hypothetical protein